MLKGSQTPLYHQFKSPPNSAKPMARWWWNNNQVQPTEIRREIQVMYDAGIGGVEINPILEPLKSWEDKLVSNQPVLEWRSSEWDQCILEAGKALKKKGMVMDVIGGSSWPFGGEFLKPEEQVRRVSIFREEVSGPHNYKLPVSDLFKRSRDYGYTPFLKPPINPTLKSVFVYPKQIDSIDRVQIYDPQLDENDTIELSIPEGHHIIAFSIEEWGYRKLGNGVPGACGPALDHFNEEALKKFMGRVLGMGESWNAPLSDYIRAIFCDSIEMGEANWTHDMLAAFENRKKYNILPYLPFVIREEDDSAELSDSFKNELRKVRYDWTDHLTSLFHERFTKPFHQLCHDHGLLSRYQPQGNPSHIDIAKGAMIPDIPEGELWLYNNKDPYDNDSYTWNQSHGAEIWIQYASAGAAITGKKIVSYEAMTNVLGVFRTTLSTIKQASDMAIICGANNAVLHGFNYSPPDVPFPGYVRFGTFFSEYNPWWPFFKSWTGYIARLNAVLQASKPVREIALLGPVAEVWEKHGPRKFNFHTEPEYFHRLWEPIAQLGSSCHYLNYDAISTAQCVESQLQCGEMRYQCLYICDVESIPMETMDNLATLSQKGLKLVFIGKTPKQAAGFSSSADLNNAVSSAFNDCINNGNPIFDSPENSDLKPWLKQLWQETQFQPKISIESVEESLYFQHNSHEGNDVLFFTNTNRKKSICSEIHYSTSAEYLVAWNAETGTSRQVDYDSENGSFQINLGPLQSVLILENNEPMDPAKEFQSTSDNLIEDSYEISTNWQLEFLPAQEALAFTISTSTLFECSDHKDERIRNFSGKIIYSAKFELKEDKFNTIDLGNRQDSICEIELNGHHIGTQIWADRRLDISPYLKIGFNEIKIRYTTTLWNYMRTTDWPKRWFNRFSRPVPEPTKTGLLGPICLVKTVNL